MRYGLLGSSPRQLVYFYAQHDFADPVYSDWVSLFVIKDFTNFVM